MAYKRNLFVCQGNVDRSVAAADMFGVMLRGRGFRVGKLEDVDGFDYYIGSAGLCVSAQNAFNGSVQLTTDMIGRAERIFVADGRILHDLLKEYKIAGKMFVQLNIEDGRSLIVPEQAEDLYAEVRRKLRAYMPH